MAILVAFSDLTILVGGPIVGAIIEASGYPTAWATIGVLVALGTVVFLLWDGAISSPALEPDAVPGEDPTPAQTDW